jgi:uncharacterized protein YjiS (DUF1127 family)
MAYTTDLRLAQPQTGFVGKLQAIKADLGARYSRYRAFRTTVNDLAILPDSVLADMGLTRSQIRSVAYEFAYGAQK